MNINYNKIGATAYMLLGAMHLVAQTSTGGLSENVLQTLAVMKETTFDFMGPHNLMQFYTGFGITMGLMLFAFGLQAFVIKKPDKAVMIVHVSVSAVASVLAVVYFHPAAYLMLLFSALCFAVGLIKSLCIKN